MKRAIPRMFVLLLSIFHLAAAGQDKQAVSATFYVDAKNGNDRFSGKSPQYPWKSLEKVNATTFAAGSKILFKCGGEWFGQLHPMGSGIRNGINVIDCYGKGRRPKISGGGVIKGAVYLYNQSYWEIRNLEITNYNPKEEKGISLEEWELKNRREYALASLPPQLVAHNTPKYGICIEAKDAGAISCIHLIHLEVHGVNGYINQADEQSKQNGGIYFGITGNLKPTYFNDILIESCNIHDVDRTGIVLSNSVWKERALTSNTNWVPSLNIKIRKNIFRTTGANALIVRVAKSPLIEHNLFDLCAIKASGNAAFSYNCDSALWQYNECKNTRANVNDHDAGGIDADYKCKNTIIQYNYIHDNDYGMLVTGGPGEFNDGTVIRYNLFEREGRFPHPKNGKSIMRISGSATNTAVYNNVFYVGADQADTKIFSHETWKTSPSLTSYYNNIIFNEGKDSGYSWGGSNKNVFDNNMYHTTNKANKPDDAHAISGEVMFINPGSGPSGYKVRKGSAAVASGRIIQGNTGKDFFGNPIPPSVKPNAGIYNGEALD